MGQLFSSCKLNCQCLGDSNGSTLTQEQNKSTKININNNNNGNNKYPDHNDNNSNNSRRIKTNEQMLQSNGVPRQGAYNTYVHPPTTVGRQSYLVNQMHRQNDVPKQVWDINDDIFSTNKPHNKPSSIRKTQPIQYYRSQTNQDIKNSSLLQYRRTQQIFNSVNSPNTNINIVNPNPIINPNPNAQFGSFNNNNNNASLSTNSGLNNSVDPNTYTKNLVLQQTIQQRNPTNQTLKVNQLVSSQSAKYRIPPQYQNQNQKIQQPSPVFHRRV